MMILSIAIALLWNNLTHNNNVCKVKLRKYLNFWLTELQLRAFTQHWCFITKGFRFNVIIFAMQTKLLFQIDIDIYAVYCEEPSPASARSMQCQMLEIWVPLIWWVDVSFIVLFFTVKMLNGHMGIKLRLLWDFKGSIIKIMYANHDSENNMCIETNSKV